MEHSKFSDSVKEYFRQLEGLGETELYVKQDLFKADAPKESEKVGPENKSVSSASGTPIQKTRGKKSIPQSPELEKFYQEIKDCTKCRLHQNRTKFVFGVGNPKSELMFIGEGPGQEEDLKGEPFVGQAGQLLDKILASIGFSREEVYIANMVKCRPPKNRNPLPDEMDTCYPYLIRQIELIRPKIICALGRISGQYLLSTKETLGKLRGKVHDFRGIKLIATYHPAALLRYPEYKRQTWEDMKLLRKTYEELGG